MLSPDVLRKLEAIEQRFEELTHQLSDPAVASSGDRFRKVSKERASAEATVNALRAYRRLLKDVEDNETLLAEKDPELRELAKEELAQLRPRVEPAEEQLKLFLVPKDPNDEKDVILEIRAGAGGDEAGLFAAELLRMYLRFAERHRWKA
ncbi:MAG TPA: PCRF domain-containing protein, partial [Anaeromyxobacter sp.]